MGSTVRLRVPVGRAAVSRMPLATRPARTTDVALLDNGQPRFAPMAPLLLGALAERPGLRVRAYRKPRYSSPAAPEVLDEIARTSQVAVVGLAC